MALRAVVKDTLDEWEEMLQALAVEVEGNQLTTHEDQFRAETLRRMQEELCTTFRGWCIDEVFIFVLIAYPRDELLRLTQRGANSDFFSRLYYSWKPPFIDWIHLLWKFSGPAHEFFADLLSMIPSKIRPSPRMYGALLFGEMMRRGIWYAETLPSVLGALIHHPLESTRVIDHAVVIHDMCLSLGPQMAGLVARSLLQYRARERSGFCRCGYQPGEVSCRCDYRNQKLQSDLNKDAAKINEDTDKEYTSALLKLVLAYFGDERWRFLGELEGNVTWNDVQIDEFIRSTCEHVFSQQVYVELYQNTRSGRRPREMLKFPRVLSEWERRNNINRFGDGDYDNGVAQHAGCVSKHCKQSFKVGCINMCCNTHCAQLGTRKCRVHKTQTPSLGRYYRKNIRPLKRRFSQTQ